MCHICVRGWEQTRNAVTAAFPRKKIKGGYIETIAMKVSPAIFVKKITCDVRFDMRSPKLLQVVWIYTFISVRTSTGWNWRKKIRFWCWLIWMFNWRLIWFFGSYSVYCKCLFLVGLSAVYFFAFWSSFRLKQFRCCWLFLVFHFVGHPHQLDLDLEEVVQSRMPFFFCWYPFQALNNWCFDPNRHEQKYENSIYNPNFRILPLILFLYWCKDGIHPQLNFHTTK